MRAEVLPPLAPAASASAAAASSAAASSDDDDEDHGDVNDDDIGVDDDGGDGGDEMFLSEASESEGAEKGGFLARLREVAPTLCSLSRTAMRSARICASMFFGSLAVRCGGGGGGGRMPSDEVDEAAAATVEEAEVGKCEKCVGNLVDQPVGSRWRALPPPPPLLPRRCSLTPTRRRPATHAWPIAGVAEDIALEALCAARSVGGRAERVARIAYAHFSTTHSMTSKLKTAHVYSVLTFSLL